MGIAIYINYKIKKEIIDRAVFDSVWKFIFIPAAKDVWNLSLFALLGITWYLLGLDSALTQQQFLWSYNSDKTNTDFDVGTFLAVKQGLSKVSEPGCPLTDNHEPPKNTIFGWDIFAGIYDIIYESIYDQVGTFWPDQWRGGGGRKVICAV